MYNNRINIMVKKFVLLVMSILTLLLASCREQLVDEIDETPIDKELLKGGWHFDSVIAVINTKNGSMQNTAANVCQNFMTKTMTVRTLYFTEDTAYCIKDIDDENIMSIARSFYVADNHILRFEQEDHFLGSWYLPFWYIKDQTETNATFYLCKDEIVDLLVADGSVPQNIIDKIESGACYCYFSKCKYPIFEEIDESEKAWMNK